MWEQLTQAWVSSGVANTDPQLRQQSSTSPELCAKQKAGLRTSDDSDEGIRRDKRRWRLGGGTQLLMEEFTRRPAWHMDHCLTEDQWEMKTVA